MTFGFHAIYHWFNQKITTFNQKKLSEFGGLLPEPHWHTKTQQQNIWNLGPHNKDLTITVPEIGFS